MTQDNLREVLQFAYCMSYAEFRTVLGRDDDPYTKEKFKAMQHDFSRWYCGLDSNNASKFIAAFELTIPEDKRQKREDKRLVLTGARCSECGCVEDIMLETTVVVCHDCKSWENLGEGEHND